MGLHENKYDKLNERFKQLPVKKIPKGKDVCNGCEGKGKRFVMIDPFMDSDDNWKIITCNFGCDGKGYVDE